MIYLDANVFLYALLYDPRAIPEAEQARKILKRVSEGDLPAATGALSWDEIVYIVRRLSGQTAALEAGERFLIFPNLRILDIDLSTLRKAQELAAQYGTKPRDAIHAACAIRSGIRDILSDDHDFDRIGEVRRIGFGDM
jgi:predicted nucleic acid-binding protein